MALTSACSGEGESDGVPVADDPARSLQQDGHSQMVELLRVVADRTTRENPWLGEPGLLDLRARVASLDEQSPIAIELNLLSDLAMTELRLGSEDRAIELYQRAILRVPKGVQGELAQSRVKLLFRLGVAYIRQAESLNCCARNAPESCIFPLEGAAIHTVREPAKNALACFTEIMLTPGQDRDTRATCRWLINIAYMALGEWPNQVPAEFLIPRSAIDPGLEFPRFQNIAAAAGVDTYSSSGGAVAEDFDGDGDLDLITGGFDAREPLQFFENMFSRSGGSAQFRNRTAAAGLRGISGGLNIVQADYDNDGDCDLLVLRGAWLGDKGDHPNSLLRNDGRGVFTDVTFDAGLGEVHRPTQTAAWADYDNDGDLDLYIGNETARGLKADCQLFRNNGDGTFTDVAKEAGVTNGRFTKGVVWGDFDGDRLPDLYVSNLGQMNRLYRNLGNGKFEDVARAVGVALPRKSFPVWFWDYNNDGRLDLFVSSYDATLGQYTSATLGEPVRSELARVYRNDGKRFVDVAADMGLTRPTMPMGSNFGDLDGDGWLDFYLGTGNVPIHEIMPNAMFRSVKGEKFEDVTVSGGLGHLQKGHAVVFADFDRDGDLDLFEQMGGGLYCDKYHDVLYENPGFSNSWVTITLRGVQSNRSAIGARIRVVVKGRSIFRHVNSGGSFGANPLCQTIGLGGAKRIEKIEVFWPTTGKTQVFADLPVDRAIRITEGATRVSFVLRDG